jgi:hypothetical protein
MFHERAIGAGTKLHLNRCGFCALADIQLAFARIRFELSGDFLERARKGFAGGSSKPHHRLDLCVSPYRLSVLYPLVIKNA